MKRRDFFRASMAAVVAAVFVEKIGFEPKIEITWREGGVSRTPGDPFDELTMVGWKATVNGQKYGDFIVLNGSEDLTPEGKARIKNLVRDWAERSIRAIPA